MPTPHRFTIVVATSARRALLERTLGSIADAVLPDEVSRLVVAENGPRSDAAAIASRFASHLPFPVEHHYSEPANKSHTLNRVLATCGDDFVIFFDDDVRLHPQCLVGYVDVVKSSSNPIFVAGRCGVDYEEQPPEWILPYLPLSAVGWSLGEKRMPLLRPQALGFNWGARASNIRAVGGFNERQGPGTPVPLGDETDLQRALLASGAPGSYEPTAQVWHYVPKNRCDCAWALRRARKYGMRKAMLSATEPPEIHRKLILRCRRRLIKFAVASFLTPARIYPRKSFHFHYHAEFERGWLDGLMGKPEANGSSNG